jgi:hypothetical protein
MIIFVSVCLSDHLELKQTDADSSSLISYLPWILIACAGRDVSGSSVQGTEVRH